MLWASATACFAAGFSSLLSHAAGHTPSTATGSAGGIGAPESSTAFEDYLQSAQELLDGDGELQALQLTRRTPVKIKQKPSQAYWSASSNPARSPENPVIEETDRSLLAANHVKTELLTIVNSGHGGNVIHSHPKTMVGTANVSPSPSHKDSVRDSAQPKPNTDQPGLPELASQRRFKTTLQKRLLTHQRHFEKEIIAPDEHAAYKQGYLDQALREQVHFSDHAAQETVRKWFHVDPETELRMKYLKPQAGKLQPPKKPPLPERKWSVLIDWSWTDNDAQKTQLKKFLHSKVNKRRKRKGGIAEDDLVTDAQSLLQQHLQDSYGETKTQATAHARRAFRRVRRRRQALATGQTAKNTSLSAAGQSL